MTITDTANGPSNKSRQEIICIQQAMVTQRQFHSHENASCFPQTLPDSPPANPISALSNISTPALEVSQSLCSLMLSLYCICPLLSFHLHLPLVNWIQLLMLLMWCAGVAAAVYLIQLCREKKLLIPPKIPCTVYLQSLSLLSTTVDQLSITCVTSVCKEKHNMHSPCIDIVLFLSSLQSCIVNSLL